MIFLEYVGSRASLSAKFSVTSWKQQVALIFHLRVRQICARIFQVIEQTSLIHPILPHQGVFPWNQNQEKFVVHSAAIENRKVLDSRKKQRIECQTWVNSPRYHYCPYHPKASSALAQSFRGSVFLQGIVHSWCAP